MDMVDEKVGRVDEFAHVSSHLLEEIYLGWGYPLVDVVEEDGELMLSLNLPETEPQALEVEVYGDLLMIVAQSGETSHGFTRTIHVPYGLGPENTRATFREGVLRISLPMECEASDPNRRVTVPIKIS